MFLLCIIYYAFKECQVLYALSHMIISSSQKIRINTIGRASKTQLTGGGGGSTPLKLKKVSFFRQNVKSIRHALKNLFY